jgi:flagellar biosynthesis/type III secretory pathway M-ring protein FliF/YscJ
MPGTDRLWEVFWMPGGALGWIVLLVVILVVLGVVVAMMMNRRRNEQRRAHATHLRHEAAAQSDDIALAEREAKLAEADAEAARAEAERAEQRAAEARQGVHMDQARQEDRIREAQRIDPDDKRV